MKNIEQLLNKENWIKYLELANQGGITNHGKAQDIVKEIEEAINYTRCCKSDSEQLRSSCDWCNGNNQPKSDGVANITDIG
ncbi:hypothetical protein N9Z41_00860 [bacterium]|nr:hypothetical protein [bacterium]